MIKSSIARLVGGAVLAVALAGCANTEVHTFNIQTAAQGTKIEARQAVALIYGQAPDSEIDRLLYSGGDLTRAIQRLRARYPLLQPLLDQGVIGNTAGGFVTLRDENAGHQWDELLWQENSDRAFLYTQATVAVGHHLRNLNGWLPYASSTFGQEWIVQGQPTWWSQDENGRWSQARSAAGR